MLVVSLVLNIAVLIPVLVVLAVNGRAAEGAWGPKTPARGITAAVYAAILVASCGLLALYLAGVAVLAWAQSLLAVQVIYKTLTVPFVGLRNPVVLSNIPIAVVHAVTLWVTAAPAGPA